MRKLLAVGVIILFFSVSVIPSTASPTREVDVELKGRIGVIITIKNIGNETVNISDWYMSVKGGHFGLINKSIKENFTLFEPGDKIVSRIFVFGFGFITIRFCVFIPPMLITGWEDMFVFGPYVYQRP